MQKQKVDVKYRYFDELQVEHWEEDTHEAQE